jgi:hypothetical protein
MAKIIILSLFLSTLSLAQDNTQNIKDLEQDFISFNYEKVLQKGQFLLADAFTTKSDSLKIYTYMLNAAYALNDTSQAKEFIISILKTDISYTLNPKKTSPKIIQFFEYIKTQENLFPQKPNGNHPITLKETPAPASPWISVSSMLLPGSGHLIKGNKINGYIHTAVSVGLISGIIISHIKTNENRDLYVSAKRSADFSTLYTNYNNAYKFRTALISAYVIWGLYNLYDINRTSDKITMEAQADGNTTKLTLGYSF